MPWWLFAPHPRVRSDRGASGEARPLCGRVSTELDSAVWQGLGPKTGLLCPHLAPKLGAATATPGHLEPADSAHGTRCQGRINPGVWAQSRQRGRAPLACPPPLESRRPLPRPQWGADEGPGPLHAPRRAKQTHDTSTSRDLGALGWRSDGDDGRFGERERHLSEKGQWPPGHHENATGRARALACAQGGPSRFLLPPATWWGVEGDGKRPQGHPVGCGVRPHSGQEGGPAARWMNHKPTAKAGPCLCR